MHFLISEVHNFGGFFGGDTVTLSGAPWRMEDAEEQTLTIDDAALLNVGERHHISAGMLLDLEFAGERVERAVLLGAANHAELRRALGEPELPAHIDAPLILARRCQSCELWVAVVAAAPCSVCGATAEP
ncbi:MAG: hypothetical protein HC822_13425 [Oscillochloris sp.]|nr:hypothetical protein [Oscillochloris sp.]